MLRSCSSLLPTPYSLFPIPYSLLRVAASREHDAAMSPPAPTHSREGARRDNMSARWPTVRRSQSLPFDRRQEGILQNRTSNTGMSMKTKDRCGKLGVKLECYRKQRYLLVSGGNVIENKRVTQQDRKLEL